MPSIIVALLGLILLLFNPLQAQRLRWDFALNSSAFPGITVNDAVTDPEGNVYIVGTFAGMVTANLGGTRNSFSNQNVFLARYDRNGAFSRYRGITAIGNLLEGASLVYKDGFIYLAGAIRGNGNSIQTGLASPPTISVSSSGSTDLLVVKYDTSLVYQWHYLAGSTGTDLALGLDVDPAGNVFVTGSFEGTVDFDGGAALLPQTSAGGEDWYVVKLSSTGVPLYVNTFGSTGNDRGLDLAMSSSGLVYVGGKFSGTFDANPSGILDNFFTSGGGEDGFLIQYFDNTTTLVYFTGITIGGTGQDEVSEVELAKGLPVIGGKFQGTGSFGSGQTRSSTGTGDIFLARYNSAVVPQWIHPLGGTDSISLGDLAVDSCGNLFVAGQYQGSVDFDPSAGTRVLNGPVTSGIYYAGYFAAQYALNGSLLFAGGEENAIRNSQAGAIAADPGGNFVVGINLTSDTDLDLSANDDSRPYAGSGNSVFLARYSTGKINVSKTITAGESSLAQAMTWTQRNTWADTVCFCLAGAGPHVISLPTGIPLASADSTVVDGTTQPGWSLGNIVLQGTGINLGLDLFGNALEVYGLTFDQFATGLQIANSTNFVVGAPSRGNQFIRNTDYGLYLTGGSGVVQANEVGTDATASVNLANGTTPAEAGIGLSMTAGPVTIGGLGTGEANTIGFNPYGVYDFSVVEPLTVVGNLFACNTSAGIGLNGAFTQPVITTADVTGIFGSGPANSTVHLYSVDFSACAGTPPCQGYSYLGSVVSDGAGDFAIPGTFTIGTMVTVTATEASGKTSPFSLCNLVDVLLDPSFLQLEAVVGELRWVASEGAWAGFEVVKKEAGGEMLVGMVSELGRMAKPDQSGWYVVKGHTLDGRTTISNEVWFQAMPSWLGRWADDQLEVGHTGAAWSGRVMDLQGKTVWEGEAQGLIRLSTQAWPRGHYVVWLQSLDGNQAQIRVQIP